MLQFQLPSELLEKRTKKIIHDYDKFVASDVVNVIAKCLFCLCYILLRLFDFLTFTVNKRYILPVVNSIVGLTK